MTVITLPSGDNIDFGDASKEDIQRNLLLLKEDKPSLFQASRKDPREEVEEVEEVEKPKVDYITGVESNILRYAFGRADNPREQKKELLNLGIPEESLSQDSQGEFILNLERIPEDIKKKYGLVSKEGYSHVAVDESSVTGEDVIEFIAAAGTPIAAGTAASIAAASAGMAAIPAALLVGGATGLSYILDEAVDYARDTRDQTSGEDAKNFFYEVLLGAGGEVGGRLLSRLFGRIIKGPGGPEANLAREEARKVMAGEIAPATVKIDPVTGKAIPGSGELVKGAPTVRSATLAPLLGRSQAFFEGVFPNKAIATRNARHLQVSYLNLLRDIKPGKISEEQAKKLSDDLFSSLEKDIDRMYSGPEALVKNAEAALSKTIAQEINHLKTKFGQGPKFGPESSGARLQIAKRGFDEVKERLYARADEAVGYRQIIPTGKVKETLDWMVRKYPAQSIAGSSLGGIIKGLDANATASTMGSIRTALGEASYDPTLIGTTQKTLINYLKKAVDDSFKEGETVLMAEAAPRIWAMDKFGVPRYAAKDKSGKFMSRKEAEDEIARSRSKKEAFEMLRRAGDFYRFGVGKMDIYLANAVIKGVQESDSILKEPARVLDIMIKPGQGQLLKDFFNAVRPIPQKGVLGAQALPGPNRPVHWSEMVPEEKINYQKVVGGPTETISLRELAIRNSKEGSEGMDDSLTRYYKRKFNESKIFADKVDESRAAGLGYKDATRQILARDWLETTINNPSIQDINGNWDPIKLAQQIGALDAGTDAMKKQGLTTARVLFGKEEIDPVTKAIVKPGWETVENMVRDFRKLPIGKGQASALLGMPIAQARRAVNKAVAKNDKVANVGWLRDLDKAVKNGDAKEVTRVATLNPKRARLVKKTLSKKALEKVKDSIMTRTLGIIGDPADEIVTRKTWMLGREVTERKLSPDFIERVMSGSVHDKFTKAFNDLGREEVEIIFGKKVMAQFDDLASKAEKISMKSIQNLGGMQTANLAASLTMGKIFQDFFGVLGTITGMNLMGRILRSEPYLKLITRPTNDLETAKNLEKILTLGWSTVLRTMPQTGADQGPIVPSEQEAEDFVARANTGTTRERPTTGPPAPMDYSAHRPSNLLTAEDLNASAALRQREMEKLLYGTQ